MLTAYSLAEAAALPDAGRASVVTIGNFDGVHLGHQSVLREVRRRATALGARAVVVTFDPHPSLLLSKTQPTPLITRLPRKLELLAEQGVDLTLVLPFTEELRVFTARQFTEHVLCDTLKTIEIHEGEGFRLGHRAEADIASLRKLGADLHFGVIPYPPLVHRGAAVSSSRVRGLVSAGQLTDARALLGRPFALDSTAAKGRGFGTRYAVPTVNLAVRRTSAPEQCPDLLPANGVYVTTLRVGSGKAARTFRGVTNAGNRPTFGEDSYAVESHLFNFSPLELQETTPLRLTLLHRLRGERRFASPDALKTQIGFDVRQAERFFRLCDHLAGT